MATASSLTKDISPHKHSGCNKLIQPLLFPERQRDNSYFYDQKNDTPIPCLLCREEFNDNDGRGNSSSSSSSDKETTNRTGEELCARQKFLHHMMTEHKLVINCIAKSDSISDIASFKCYAHYWKERFTNLESLDSVLPVIQTNPETRTDYPERYYLLSDVQSKEKHLRQFLQTKRLQALLDLQQLERNDTNFKRKCIFCHETITGKRETVFEHLYHAHQFHVGQPDNIVMIHQFLDLLQFKLDNLQCLYCERTFRDHVTLRDHMRKKLHKRINPNNKLYDKFYIINYLEFGKSWEEIKKEKDKPVLGNEEDHDEDEESNEDDSATSNNWNDWIESPASYLTCLFCGHFSQSLTTLNAHMKEVHGFDFESVTQEMDYYSKVKIINYIRRQVYSKICIYCNHDHRDVLEHMSKEEHFKLPKEKTLWDQSQYLFPTYENDELLCAIDDERP